MQHEMRLAKIPFEKMRNGTKTIESRLFDEKRQRIGLGDEIIFRLNDDPSQTAKRTVVSLHRYSTFRDMMSDLPPERFGWETAEEAIAEINRFFTGEEQGKFGIIGIGLA